MSEQNRRFDNASQSTGLSSRRSPLREYLEVFEHESEASEQTSASTSSSSQDEPVRREGFDLDMFIKCEEKYQCPICVMVMRDPVQTQCGHRFCNACIKFWISRRHSPQCPVCQTPVTKSDIFPDNYAKREVLSLIVKCLHHKEGCNHQMELRHQDEHEKECPYAVVDCPNGCSEKISRHRLEEHKESCCIFRYQLCNSCQNQFQFIDLEKHQQICGEKEVDCPHCHKIVKRKEV